MTHQFKTPVNLLTEPQREWFASALISMILADGNVTQGEVDTLLSSIGFVSNPVAVERLKKFVHYRAMPTLNPFRGWEREMKFRAMMLLDMMEVAIADRDFSGKEREQFHRLGVLLGIPRDKVEELIQRGAACLEQLPSPSAAS